jgi:hypothetical protein
MTGIPTYKSEKLRDLAYYEPTIVLLKDIQSLKRERKNVVFLECYQKNLVPRESLSNGQREGNYLC